MGHLCQDQGIVSFAPAGPIVPRHLRVFSKNAHAAFVAPIGPSKPPPMTLTLLNY